MKRLLAAAVFASTGAAAHAAPLSPTERAAITRDVDGRAPALAATARSIWNWAEVGYQENKSSALLQSELEKAGFSVKAGVAGMPTAFVASFTHGDGPVSATLHWHPGDANGVSVGKSQANISGKFRFTGRAAHASAAPWLGRSALDGVEVMDVATNFLREHIPIGTRIHYVVTDGGKAPNVVPEKAEVYYYVRHTDPQVVKEVWARVGKAAGGAALATDTSVETEITGGVYSMLGNDALAAVMQRNLLAVGGPVWSAVDRQWAEAVSKTLQTPKPLDEAARVGPIYRGEGGGSTDVSDISWTTPTVGMQAATWVPGTPAHSWQAAAASGTPMAAKAGVVAAKTMALTAAELFRSPETLAAARAELIAARGPGFSYHAMVGDRAPPLDYRKAAGGD